MGVAVDETRRDHVAGCIELLPAALAYVSERQINFYVPPHLPHGTADLVIRNPLGTSLPQRVSIQAVNPGIFFDAASGIGAILIAGTGRNTIDRPAASGDFLEIYTTGLGGSLPGSQPIAATPQVLIGNVPVQVQFSGPAPGFTGLHQINVRVPGGLAAGIQPVTVNMNGTVSNSVNIRVR